jgi:hypothetical protein
MRDAKIGLHDTGKSATLESNKSDSSLCTRDWLANDAEPHGMSASILRATNSDKLSDSITQVERCDVDLTARWEETVHQHAGHPSQRAGAAFLHNLYSPGLVFYKILIADVL